MERLIKFLLLLLLAVGATLVLAQEEYVTPAENLVVEGVPAIPAAMPGNRPLHGIPLCRPLQLASAAP